jgi:23S rRNA pseudouridine2605 synthase
VEKEYLAQVEGVPGRSALRLLRTGVELEDGRSAPAKVGVVGDVADAVLRIVIHEGRNRQVRRMCEAVGHPVKRLVRVRVGPIVLRALEPGDWRELTARELRALNEAAASDVRTGSSPKLGKRVAPAIPRVRPGGSRPAGL